MKLVILNGSSCSGKSTAIKAVMKEREGYFHLSYDTLKWQFSRYVSGKYTKDIYEIMVATLQALLKQKHNVICEAYHPAQRVELITLAKKEGYEIVEINIEAEKEVLIERFNERVAAFMANPEKKIANRSIERFEELYKMYQDGKNPDAIVIRSDTQSIEEVWESILKYL